MADIRAFATAPVVSVAVPVYNGDRDLRQALDSVLAQSFQDLEVVIVDNASTDGTEAIAREYMRADSRVRYHRNAANLGAARNFNLAVSLTRGRYFKWAAHDDVLHPAFLERCVGELDRDQGVVLAFPRTRIVDEKGAPIEDYRLSLPTDAPQCTVRFEALLIDHKCFQIFGLIRRSALEKSTLIGLHAHGDGVLLGRLALIGRFAEIPEYLFYARQHPLQSMSMVGNYWDYAVWFDPRLAGKARFPHWRLFGEYVRSVATAPIPIRERVSSLRTLIRVNGSKWPLLRGDILFHVRPMLESFGVPPRLLRKR